MPSRPYCVALTGGIASGKSTVAEQFAAMGAIIIDTDQIARELVAPGQPALGEMVHAFGRDILLVDGRLNRPALRQRVFADATARATLNAILHPRIHTEVSARLHSLPAHTGYALLVIPLLVESGERYATLIDRVLLVDCSEDTQIQRLMQRDRVNATQAKAMLAAQASRQARLIRADDVIDNSAEREQLLPRIAALHQDYLQRAQVWAASR